MCHRVIPLTGGPQHHFFGYYDKSPWNPSETLILAMETDVSNRPPGAEDQLTIGIIEHASAARPFHRLATTRAWNWQQGCMARWLPSTDLQQVLFNDRRDGQFTGVVMDITTGRQRDISRPVYHLSADGKTGLSLNFARLHHARPGYGYAGVVDTTQNQLAPANDGIHRVNLDRGDSSLIISLEQLANWEPVESMHSAIHWVNHLLFAPHGKRFVFVHRWRHPGAQTWTTRLFTADEDGANLYCLIDAGLISHFDWLDDEHLLVWARQTSGDHYYLLKDRTHERFIVGDGVLDVDGHCSFSPDRRWILTDTYPDATNHQTLILFDRESGRRIDVARLRAMPAPSVDVRCDLHPRWSPSGSYVAIDSTQDGSRQMYYVDVTDIHSAIDHQ